MRVLAIPYLTLSGGPDVLFEMGRKPSDVKHATTAISVLLHCRFLKIAALDSTEGGLSNGILRQLAT